MDTCIWKYENDPGLWVADCGLRLTENERVLSIDDKDHRAGVCKGCGRQIKINWKYTVVCAVCGAEIQDWDHEPWDTGDPPAWACDQDPARCSTCGALLAAD